MRYLPHTEADRALMLRAIGVESVDDLFREVPTSARHASPFPTLPTGQGEWAVEQTLRALAAKNMGTSSVPSFLGGGAYRHHIPAAVDHLIQRGEFLTSYTPYQPEISQGTLQSLFEFQTLVCQLTGMDVANASLYDGATATAEAALMACRITGRPTVRVHPLLHPHYRETLETYLKSAGRTLAPLYDLPAPGHPGTPDATTACVIIQTPDFQGNLHDIRPLAEACHAAGALLVVVVTEIVSLGLLPSPGSGGADIVAAEGQSLGSPLSFGGPHLGLLATRERFVRQMPGRLCGQTVDTEGKRGWVLTLSAREQHIRREKATSNVCTNSGLCALAFSIHLALLGEEGFKRLARLNHQAACRLADRLTRLPGVRLINDSFFNEFTVFLPRPAAPVVDALAARRILGGIPLSRFDPAQENLLLVAATELTTPEEEEALVKGLGDALRQG